MEAASHSLAVRIWNRKMHTDEITLPSGKTYTLISIPYYLISQLNNILNKALI